MWTTLFIYSKIPELMDTTYLVLAQKPVIFLHWFHHFTVLLYCWHSFHMRIAPGLWFAAMNFTVHGIMYSYYSLMSLQRMFSKNKKSALKRFLIRFAPFITTVQILQMVMGMYVISFAGRQRMNAKESCHIDPANYKLGLAMYTCYCALFVVLFGSKYLTGGKSQASGRELKRSSSLVRVNHSLRKTASQLHIHGECAHTGDMSDHSDVSTPRQEEIKWD